MAKNMKTRKGKDGFNYPYTSPDLVIDKTGKSATKKFEEINSQFKDIVNKIAQGGLGIVFENVEDGEVFTSIKEVIECTSISLDKTELSFTNTIPQH